METKQFGDLKIQLSYLGLDIYNNEGEKICFLNKKGTGSLSRLVINNNIKLYKSYKDYADQNNIHRHTAKTRMDKMLKDGDVIEIPKGMKYIRVD